MKSILCKSVSAEYKLILSSENPKFPKTIDVYIKPCTAHVFGVLDGSCVPDLKENQDKPCYKKRFYIFLWRDLKDDIKSASLKRGDENREEKERKWKEQGIETELLLLY